MTYLPICWEDLTYATGCCSLRCKAATELVPLRCYAEFQATACRSVIVPVAAQPEPLSDIYLTRPDETRDNIKYYWCCAADE